MWTKIYNFSNYEINELGEIRRLLGNEIYKILKGEQISIWVNGKRACRISRKKVLKELETFGELKKQEEPKPKCFNSPVSWMNDRPEPSKALKEIFTNRYTWSKIRAQITHSLA